MKTIKNGRAVSFTGELETVAKKPIPISALRDYHNPDTIAHHGGGYLHNYEGDNIFMQFDPTTEGFIKLTLGTEEALVHKDELIFIARYAKGSMGI